MFHSLGYIGIVITIQHYDFSADVDDSHVGLRGHRTDSIIASLTLSVPCLTRVCSAVLPGNFRDRNKQIPLYYVGEKIAILQQSMCS
jgi:hypothetical protein